MKLRNKKTGEIINNNGINFLEGDYKTYNSLAELNSEWEDAPEEPKKYWFINASGEINSIYEEDEEEEDTKSCKEIGNYFETKEEAEKAVRKLKAWKRLKDKGLYFVRDAVKEGEYEHNFVLRPVMPKDKRCVPMDAAKEIYNDIKLIFEHNIKEVKNEN